MNISSLVVKTKPERMEAGLAALSGSGLCEIHFQDSLTGMIIVTVEGADIEEEMIKVKAIEKLPHILEAALVYAYSEAELEDAFKKIAGRKNPSVPEILQEGDRGANL